ncbi:MAG: FAD-dependent oxidoreductase [Candidatus Omnitrophica bacterium]|nr:FAD-dependent oxidoreductase [Candidatus Omnitrophota bacterium]MCB9747747.1 FAD-dependent oxidoreductase [Candidatus Omnitrophota bacterium]
MCGRICTAPCELRCILQEESSPIGIRALERYASDYGRGKGIRNERVLKGKKIAIVGSGPSGLAAAAELAQRGYQVTVFEALDEPGGVLRYGIPEYRIPKKVLNQEIQEITALGVEFVTSAFIGQTHSLQQLSEEGFVAILLATGAGSVKFMDIPGSNLGGVYYGEEFLIRVNLAKVNLLNRASADFFIGEKVVVIGSGNTALDCARSALRFDRKATMIFRKSFDDLRVRKDEIHYAGQEGVQFEPLVKPIEILADQNNFVSGLKCVRMDYAQKSGQQGWEIIPVPDSEFIIDADTVIIAIGHSPNNLLQSHFAVGLLCNDDGTIKVDVQSGLTSVPGVFACGNVVTNAGPVVDAIASGYQTAVKIDAYITNHNNQQELSSQYVS